jgi:hypothetical protein
MIYNYENTLALKKHDLVNIDTFLNKLINNGLKNISLFILKIKK